MSNNVDSTIADVLAFARSKPAGERYHYSSLNNCALAQFARHAGIPIHGRERHLLERGSVGWAACAAGGTFGGFTRELERIIEPSLRKRLWARITGRSIGCAPIVSDTWTKADAYLSDIEQVRA